MQTKVEELAEDRVRLTVEVPSHDVKHAVEHAASDLAGTVKIPGFRKGKVPLPVLVARVGKERVYAEAVESHIGGWFRNAAADERVRWVAQPQYDYELPDSSDAAWSFSATVEIQPKIDVADWNGLEVPAADVAVPAEAIDQQLELLRASVAELAPVDRPAQEGDVVTIDLVGPQGTQRDYVLEVGDPRLLAQANDAIVGMRAGETKSVEWEDPEGPGRVEITVKDVKEKVLPALDDELARASSEFDTLAELRADIEEKLREQVEDEVEAQFRGAVADVLVQASKVQPAVGLVQARATELLRGLIGSLDARGISPETYLAVTGQTGEQLQERLLMEAARAIARELVLEAAADKLAIQVDDAELSEFIKEHAVEAEEEDPDSVVQRVFESGRHEPLRQDLRLRKALDRVAAEVKRIPLDLARAREKLWTPEKEKGPTDTKLWTPQSKEPA